MSSTIFTAKIPEYPLVVSCQEGLQTENLAPGSVRQSYKEKAEGQSV